MEGPLRSALEDSVLEQDTAAFLFEDDRVTRGIPAKAALHY